MIECPYCKHKNKPDYPDDYENGEKQCGDCLKEFSFCVNIRYSWSSFKDDTIENKD